jgi:hypothetical protein
MTKRFKPQYLPYNDAAHAMVETLSAELSLTLNAATGAKHRAVLSSFLYYVQEAGAGTLLNWSGGTTSQDTTGFSFFPASGAATIVGISMLVFVPENADVYDMVDPDEKTLGKLYQYPRCAYNAVRRTSDEDCFHVGEVAANISGGNPGAFDYMWFWLE